MIRIDRPPLPQAPTRFSSRMFKGEETTVGKGKSRSLSRPAHGAGRLHSYPPGFSTFGSSDQSLTFPLLSTVCTLIE